MTYEAEHRVRSVIVGDLRLPPEGADEGQVDPGEKVPMLVELNLRYPGGLVAVRQAFYTLWADYADRAGGSWPAEPTSVSPVQPPVPRRLALVAPKLYQCVLSRADAQQMVAQDRGSARESGRPPVIFRVWPDYTLQPQIDRSAATVKADAAWRSYDARGRGIVWAVIDSGIDASYGLAPGIFYRIDAASVINDTAGNSFAGAHSDIKKLPVAQLAAAAAAAHA